MNLGQPISHRLDHLLSGVRAQIAIKVFGPDMNELRRFGGEIYDALKEVKGIVDLQTEPLVLVPQLKIAIDRESGNPYGIRAGTLAADLEIALNGEVVSQFLDNQKIHDVFVRLDDESRATPDKISDILIKFMPNGKPIDNKLTDSKLTPATTQISDVIAKDMKKRGFKFFGSTICYAHMQATGLVNDHLLSCPRHAAVATLAC